MDNKKGQAIETNMHEKAWWAFAFACSFAFIFAYGMVEDLIRQYKLRRTQLKRRLIASWDD